MAIALGLDCGGSSCRTMAQTESGETLFQGQSGPTNLATTPPGRLKKNLEKALAGCPSVDAVCGCFAGLLTREDRQRAESLLKEFFPHAQIKAEPDYAAALMASEEGTDLLVIAGTGAIVCSRFNGKVVKSGGKGFLLGDWGSAYRYGKAALEHYIESPELSSAALKEIVLERFHSLEENEILAKLYRGGTPAPTLAKLLPAFTKDLKSGEAYAQTELREQTKRLVQAVTLHKERYLSDKNCLNISLSGGLWEASSLFRTAFDEELQSAMPNINIVSHRIQQPPVRGAVLLARELIS